MRAFPAPDDQLHVAAEDPENLATDEAQRQAARRTESIEKPRGISISQLNVWRECPARWGFTYRSHLPQPPRDPLEPPSKAEIGHAIHQILEAAGRIRLQGHVAHTQKAGRRELLGYLKHLAATWEPLLIAEVEALIPMVAPIDLSRVVAVEEPCQVELPNGKKAGCVLDRVDVASETHVECVDYKSGFPKTVLQLEREPQTAVYFAALKTLYPGAQSVAMRYEYVSYPGEKPRVVVYDQELVQWGLWLAAQICDRMDEKDSRPPAKTGPHCGGCQFVLRCPEGARWVKNRQPQKKAAALEVVAEVEAQLFTPEELCQHYALSKDAEDAESAIRVAFGRELRRLLGERGTPSFGRFHAAVRHREVGDYAAAALEPLAEAMGVDVATAFKKTKGLQKKASEAWCRNNQAALDVLARHKSLDCSSWVHVEEKGAMEP